jgi:hypothetical protein
VALTRESLQVSGDLGAFKHMVVVFQSIVMIRPLVSPVPDMLALKWLVP